MTMTNGIPSDPIGQLPTKEYPHVPAAFINNIAEEGTKEEAIEWLQKQWNETCYLRSLLKQYSKMVTPG